MPSDITPFAGPTTQDIATLIAEYLADVALLQTATQEAGSLDWQQLAALSDRVLEMDLKWKDFRYQLATLLFYRTAGAPTKISLRLPTYTSKLDGKVMPNFELPNDEVVTIGIETTNAGGAVEPVPTGSVFTATSSSPSLGVAIAADTAGAPTLVLTPLVATSPGIVVTVADSGGLPSVTLTVDIVVDVTPANVVLNTVAATHTTQQVPTAPGP